MKEKDHIYVTNVTKRSPRAVISFGIGVFTQEKKYLSVLSVTKNLQSVVIF
jgi:ABC-type branched-subunit amino acid transport system ATPase component